MDEVSVRNIAWAKLLIPDKRGAFIQGLVPNIETCRTGLFKALDLHSFTGFLSEPVEQEVSLG